MTDGEQFLIVLSLIYLSGCLKWGPRHAVVFLSLGFGGWSMRRPSPWMGNESGGLVISLPIPPLGEMFFSQQWPVAITEVGVSSPGPDNPNPGGAIFRRSWVLKWDEVESVVAQKRELKINGKLVRVSSFRQARVMRDLILKIKNAAPGNRAQLIRSAVRSSLNQRRAKRKFNVYRKSTWWLRLLCNLLFLAVFVGVPFVYKYQLDQLRLGLAAGIWLMMLQIGVEYFRLHRKWQPEARAERWQELVMMLLYPPHTIRAHDALSVGHFAEFHPLALGATVLSNKRFSAAADSMKRDLDHPLDSQALDATEETKANSREFVQALLRPELSRFTKDTQFDCTKGEGLHCPRCLAEYVDGQVKEETCEDCHGLPLVRSET